jgi:uncharacterized protein YraI
MSKLISISLSAVVLSMMPLLTLGCETVQAQSYSVKQDVSDGVLNMRDGPGTGHRLLRSIPAGSGGLSIGECRNPDDGTSRFKWCYTSWRGQSGWISSCCVELEDNVTPRRVAAGANAVLRADDMRRHGIAWSAFEPRMRPLPIGCPYQGEGWTLSFSREFYQSYVARGFSLKAMCLALASSNAHFDPETGAAIKCYRLAGWEDGGCFPFYVSDCFRTVQVMRGDGTAEQYWRPTGCNINYDPDTGRAVRRPSDVSLLYTGGGAGDAPDENTQTRSSVDDARLGHYLSGQ